MWKFVVWGGIQFASALIGAAVAVGEVPEVETRLEEAASAGASLSRVLVERMPKMTGGCRFKDCGRTGTAARDDIISESGIDGAAAVEPLSGERPSVEVLPTDGATTTGSEGVGKMGGMRRMDGMRKIDLVPKKWTPS